MSRPVGVAGAGPDGAGWRHGCDRSRQSAPRRRCRSPARPIVDRILRWLRAAGVRARRAESASSARDDHAVVGDGRHWGLDVRYSWEPTVLGSAGGPRRALPLLDADRFLIVNGDTLTDCDLEAARRAPREAGALVTMAVVPGDVERYGGVVVGPDGFVAGIRETRRKTRPPYRRRAPRRPPGISSACPARPTHPTHPRTRSCMHVIGIRRPKPSECVGAGQRAL